MYERAKVVSVEKDGVMLSCSTSACTGCKGKMFCNIKEQLFEATNPKELSLQVGDEVEIYLHPKQAIFQSFSMLIFPLLLFLVGYVVTAKIFHISHELIQAVGGFVGMIIGFFSLFLYNRRKRGLGKAEIVGVYGTN